MTSQFLALFHLPVRKRFLPKFTLKNNEFNNENQALSPAKEISDFIPENEKAKTLKILSGSDFLPINAPEYNLAD